MYYLNLGSAAAAGGAVSVGSSAGTWVGGLRHGCNTTIVTLQHACDGAGEGGPVSSAAHDGMCVALCVAFLFSAALYSRFINMFFAASVV